MTKRYPLRGPLSRGNSRDSRHFQRVSLGVFEPAHRLHHARLHLHETLRHGRPSGHRFGRHVDHPHFALRPVMRKLGHQRRSVCHPEGIRRGRLKDLNLNNFDHHLGRPSSRRIRQHPFSTTPKHFPPQLASLALRAQPRSNALPPAPRCHPTLAISKLSPQERSRAIRCALEGSG